MTRLYCWRTGEAYARTAAGDCPECGPHTALGGHRLLSGDACQAFAACGGDPYRQEHGHPCELPAGHEGGRAACACPVARAACAAAVPSRRGEAARP